MYALAGGDITKFTECVHSDYWSVFHTIRYRITQARTQKRLHDIKARKQ